MTKEELETEAREYLRRQTQLNGGGLFRCNILNLILGFAEPREKQLQEKDKKITDLTEQNTSLLTSVENLNKSVQELEKENAELKEQISTKDILIKELQEQKVYWKESSFDWRHKFFKLDKVKRLIKKDKQLTKAKDHIKKLLDCLKQDTNDPETNYYVCQYMDEAEQFLSEVEK